MKKRVFLQKSILIYICLLILLGMLAACICALIYLLRQGLSDLKSWIVLVAAIWGGAFCIYTFIRMARNRIILLANEIFVPEQWGSKSYKTQYETHIAYTEIENIFITISAKNSLGGEASQIFTPMPYIIFECKSGQKAINVYYYTKRQVIQIINMAIAQAKLLGNNLAINGESLMLDFLKNARIGKGGKS